MKYVKRILKWLAVLLPALLLLSLVAVYWLLATNTGSAWLVKQLSDVIRPQVQVSYESFSGNFLESLSVTGLQLRLPTTPALPPSEIDLQQFALSWQPLKLFDAVVQIDDLTVDGVFIKMSAQDDVPAGEPLQIPQLKLPVDIVISRFVLQALTLNDRQTPPVIEKFSVAARFKGGKLDLEQIEFVHPQLDLQGAAAAMLDSSQLLSGDLTIRADAPEVGEVRSSVKLAGRLLSPQMTLKVTAPLTLQADITADIEKIEPQVKVDLSWAQLQWPLQGDADYSTDSGRLSFSGTQQNYQIGLQTKLHGAAVPAANVDFRAHGNMQQLHIDSLVLNTLEGNVNISGPVEFAEQIAWDIQLDAAGINPGQFDTRFAGLLDADLHLSGRQAADKLSGNIQINKLKGKLRDYPVDIHGAVKHDDASLLTEQLLVSIGDNLVKASGKVAGELDLTLDINAPELAQLYPELAGNVKGTMQLSGNTESPVLLADLKAADIVYQQYVVSQMNFVADWQGQNGSISLLANRVSASGSLIDELKTDIKGDLSSHRISSSVKTVDGSVQLALDGNYSDSDWSGRIDVLQLQHDLFEWRLQKPSVFKIAADKYQLDPLCLQGQSESLCLQGDWSAQSGVVTASGKLQGLQFRQFQKLFPEGLEVDGSVDGNFDVSGTTDKLNAVFALQPTDGSVQFLADGEALNIPYRNVVLNGKYANDEARAKISFDLGQQGKADGNLLMGKGPLRKLDGSFKASLPDLRVIQGFVPDLQDIQGNLQADLKLRGQLDNPLYDGVISINDAAANLPAGGLEIKDINVRLEADGQKHLKMKATANSGDGSLLMQGLVDASKIPASMDLTLKGDNFQVARLPEAVVTVSPDLRLHGDKVLTLTGKLLVPQANIEIQQLPASVTTVSDDEVIVGKAPVPPKQRNLRARVNLELGKDVTFKGFGLTTGLTGLLEADYDGASSQLFGQIQLRDAKYDAYGQKLDVETGRLIFSGPTDNAGVDLKAKRVSIDKDTTAYLAVSGSLAKPSVKVYTEPALPEAEALAYLITGRNLSNANKEAGNEIASAAFALGLSKSMPALNEMGERLGLDELRFESGDGGYEDTSLTVGKYLSPELYLGYVHGLFDASGSLMINYKFTERIELESLSGDEESVDLYYRFEHD